MQRKVVYPKIAPELCIQSKESVKALISKAGDIQKTDIDLSDCELSDNASIEAIMITLIIPAKQNWTNVSCWVMIPVEFKLR